jgi:cell division initiation protein
MTADDSPTEALDAIQDKRRLRPAPLGQRLSRLVLGSNSGDAPPGGRRLAAWLRDERGSLGEDVIPRFALVKQGYDCRAVDTYVDELERDIGELDRELVELRARVAAPDEVAGELKRIGEQTSSVLIAAHEQQQEILRAAREQAERCVAEATAKANATTAEAEARVRELEAKAEARVRQLEAKAEAAHRQRDRLLENARAVSAELAALADASQEQIPALAPGG